MPNYLLPRNPKNSENGKQVNYYLRDYSLSTRKDQEVWLPSYWIGS